MIKVSWMLVVIMALALFVNDVGAAETVRSRMTISSPAFADNGDIPSRYTCDGLDIHPPLVIANVPAETRSLAIIMDDLDAPGGTWTHWLIWNIPPDTKELAERVIPRETTQGVNNWREEGYAGPCPPSSTHRYFFRLYALDAPIDLQYYKTKENLRTAMQGHILSEAILMGRYSRK